MPTSPDPTPAAATPDIDLRKIFLATFGDAPAGRRIHVVRAPGRVNLIGEHTDYNDGFVFPMAIEPQVTFLCRGRDDGLVRITSTYDPTRSSGASGASGASEQMTSTPPPPLEVFEFSVDRRIERVDNALPASWTNYSRGVAAELIGAGVPITGMDVLLSNTLPVGGGLSSSAAIEVGTALSFLAIENEQVDRDRLALLCQKAEHEYALVPCGIMDQTIVASGRAGHAMLLDCRDNSKRFVPINPAELRVVIVNSMVKHELSGGEYKERRDQCERAVKFFQQTDPAVRALRDVTPARLQAAEGKLDDVTFRRCRHVIGEIARTVEAADLLAAERYEEVGRLMVQSHASLRDDYEVSTPELDYLAEQATTVKGVYGARMTGGGFGGCIVALVQPRAVEALTQHLKKVYPTKVGRLPEIYVTTATDGASVLE